MKVNLKDYWAINSIWWSLIGVFVILDYPHSDKVIFAGGLYVLIGYGLLRKSKIAFWAALILSTLGFFSKIARLSKLYKATGNFSLTFSFIIPLIPFALALMLWQQIRKNKK